MKLRINANETMKRRFLEVDGSGLTYCETLGFGGERKFGFHEIDLILLSEAHMLSFQVGREMFSIPTKPGDATHQALIASLLSGVEGSRYAPSGTASPQTQQYDY